MHIQVNNFSMAYSDIGQGPPMLFIHGYPLNRQIWASQSQELSAKSRILTPDLRGHGDSQAVAGPYTMDLLATDLATFLDSLKVKEPIILGGLSMGGYIAFAFYRKYPKKVRGLILTATRAAADSPEGKTARDQAAKTARQQGVAAIAQEMLPKLFAPKTLANNPQLVNEVQKIMEKTSLEGVLGDLAAMKDRPDSTPILSTIQAPTLIIHGEQDAIIPLQEAQAMQQAIPNACLHIIEEAGHLLNMENPAVFNQSVGQFLEQL